MSNAYPIKFEKRKNEQYLTISCLIKDAKDKDIKKIQKNLWKELNNEFNDVKFAESIKELNEETNKDLIIYKYPLNRIHFSLFSISTRIVPRYSFEEMAKSLKKEKRFKEIKNELKKIIKEDILYNKNFSKSWKIRRIYFPQKIENSIALNIYTSINFSDLKILEKKIKNKLEKYHLEGEIKLKIYNEEYFAINLIRFIHKEKDDYFRESLIYKKIEKINRNLEANPIDVNFLVRPTISDPYLSNRSPFLR